MYSRLQKQLFELYKKLEPKAEQIYGIDEDSLLKNCLQFSSEEDKNSDGKNEDDEEDEAVSSALNELSASNNDGSINVDTVKRLLGSVSFGFGMFQICISFLPPNILKLVKIFGKIFIFLLIVIY